MRTSITITVVEFCEIDLNAEMDFSLYHGCPTPAIPTGNKRRRSRKGISQGPPSGHRAENPANLLVAGVRPDLATDALENINLAQRGCISDDSADCQNCRLMLSSTCAPS